MRKRRKKTIYLCGTSAEWEIGYTNVSVYGSADSCALEESCTDTDGIVKAKVKLCKYVKPAKPFGNRRGVSYRALKEDDEIEVKAARAAIDAAARVVGARADAIRCLRWAILRAYASVKATQREERRARLEDRPM